MPPHVPAPSGTLSVPSPLPPGCIFSSAFLASRAPSRLSTVDRWPHLAQGRWPGVGFPSPTANLFEGPKVSSLWSHWLEREQCLLGPTSAGLAPHRPLPERGQEAKWHVQPEAASMNRLEWSIRFDERFWNCVFQSGRVLRKRLLWSHPRAGTGDGYHSQSGCAFVCPIYWESTGGFVCKYFSSACNNFQNCWTKPLTSLLALNFKKRIGFGFLKVSAIIPWDCIQLSLLNFFLWLSTDAVSRV